MAYLVKTKYVVALRSKLAELRAQKLSDAEIIVALNAPVLVKAADPRAVPPTDAVYGPSWAQSIGLGMMLPEFIGQVDGYAGLTDEQVRDELAKLLLDACLTRGLRAEGKTVADATAERAPAGEKTRWKRIAGTVEAYTGIADRERVETLATELVAATREAPITEVQR